MQKFIFKPSVELISGIKVTKDTVLEFERENIKQTLKDLVFRSTTKVKGENYESVIDTTIMLDDGDILVFEEEGRGYVKPATNCVVTIEEAINDLVCIKDLGDV